MRREALWGRKVGGKGRDGKGLVGSCVPGQCYFRELKGPECGLGSAGLSGRFYFAGRCCFGVERGEKVNPDFGWKFKKCYRGFDCYKVSVPTGIGRSSFPLLPGWRYRVSNPERCLRLFSSSRKGKKNLYRYSKKVFPSPIERDRGETLVDWPQLDRHPAANDQNHHIPQKCGC